jgi:hypothetical protein
MAVRSLKVSAHPSVNPIMMYTHQDIWAPELHDRLLFKQENSECMKLCMPKRLYTKCYSYSLFAQQIIYTTNTILLLTEEMTVITLINLKIPLYCVVPMVMTKTIKMNPFSPIFRMFMDPSEQMMNN